MRIRQGGLALLLLVVAVSAACTGSPLGGGSPTPTTPPPTPTPTPVDTAPPVFAGVTGAVNNSDGTATLSWSAATDDVSGPSQITYTGYLASNLSFKVGAVTGATSLVTAPFPAGSHAFVVRASDQAGMAETNTAQASAVFTVPAVSFSVSVQPIFSARCALPMCHDTTTHQDNLDLSAGAAYGSTVDVTSLENPALKRVLPSDCNNSWLYLKVGPGGSMSSYPASQAQVAAIREWILDGAQNN